MVHHFSTMVSITLKDSVCVCEESIWYSVPQLEPIRHFWSFGGVWYCWPSFLINWSETNEWENVRQADTDRTYGCGALDLAAH